jgi:hypothetical protein
VKDFLINTPSEITELSSDGKDVSIDTLSESTDSSSSCKNSEDAVANFKEVPDDAAPTGVMAEENIVASNHGRKIDPFLVATHRFAHGDCFLSC